MKKHLCFLVTAALAASSVLIPAAQAAYTGPVCPDERANVIMINSIQDTLPMKAPAENIFRVSSAAGTDKEKQFILLDKNPDSETSRYLIMAYDGYGKHVYDPDDTQKFDPEDPNNIAYWLNNEFLENGNGSLNNHDFVLPAQFKPYIDGNHVWETEPGNSSGNANQKYSVTCGIALMAQYEYLYYKDKVGREDNARYGAPGGEIWFFRTGRSTGKNEILGSSFLSSGDSGRYTNSVLAKQDLLVRPLFWVGEDFFRNVKLTSENLGENVGKELLEISKTGTMPAYGAGDLEYITNLSETTLQKYSRNGSASDCPGAIQNTAASNTFSVGGREFILLDTTNDADSKFFIMTKDGYGYREYDPDSSQRFDIYDPNNIGYWLNHEFLDSGNPDGPTANKTYQLPAEIVAGIDRAHVWTTEPGMSENAAYPIYNCPKTYEFTAPLALLSRTEWAQYYQRFGYRDNVHEGARVEDNPANKGNIGWWLRTSRGNGGEGGTILFNRIDLETEQPGGAVNNGIVSFRSPTEKLLVRPVFYLKDDFFATTKLDNVIKTGSEIVSYIRLHYTRDDFASLGYTDEETNFLFGSPLEVTSVSYQDGNGQAVTSVPAVGEKLKVDVKLTNNYHDTQATVILGCYDGAGALRGVYATPKQSIIGGQSVDFHTEITVPDASGLYFRWYVWEDVGNMRPLFEDTQFPQMDD